MCGPWLCMLACLLPQLHLRYHAVCATVTGTAQVISGLGSSNVDWAGAWQTRPWGRQITQKAAIGFERGVHRVHASLLQALMCCLRAGV